MVPATRTDVVDADGDSAMGGGGASVPPAFEAVSDEQYDALVTKEEADASTEGRAIVPILNPEQRRVCRSAVSYLLLQASMKSKGGSAEDIYNAAMDSKIEAEANILLLGGGGTGKTMVMLALREYMENHLQLRLAATAYTGVAATLHGAPTILTALNISITDKSDRQLEKFDAQTLQKKQACLEKHYGIKLADVGAFVIDELSFCDAKIIGHVDNIFRQLLGAPNVPFGGMLVIFAGKPIKRPLLAACRFIKSPWRTLFDPVALVVVVVLLLLLLLRLPTAARGKAEEPKQEQQQQQQG